MLFSRFFIFVFSAFMVLALASCAQLGKKENNIQLELKVKDPNRVRFSGKGAGMMMMSSLGPAAVAIGIAIDEGIGKDIDEVYQKHQLSITNMLEASLKAEFDSSKNTTLSDVSVVIVSIDRFGFIAKGDDVIAELNISYDIDGQSNSVSYPKDFSALEPIKASLEQLKTAPEPLERLLNDAAAQVAKALVNGV